MSPADALEISQQDLLAGLQDALKSMPTLRIHGSKSRKQALPCFRQGKADRILFEERPLDPRILAYCAQDVALIFQLEAAMKRTTIVERSLGDSWDKRILFGSANRVAESKSPNYDGRSRENRAIAPTL